MPIKHHSTFAVLATGISAVLTLSACQATTKDEAAVAKNHPQVVKTTAAHNTAAMHPHAGHNMSSGSVLADGAPMTAMLKDYKNSMTIMHKEMMIGMTYNDPDAAFAQGMLGHHIGAVDMAKIELKYGTDKTMRQLAQDIIAAQNAEIVQMQTWLANHPDSKNPTPNTKAMQQAYADGMDAMHEDMMLGIADPVPDMAFARGMLPHHIGAVDMAEVQLKYGKNEEMRQLAQDIIDAQQPEIELMHRWIMNNKK